MIRSASRDALDGVVHLVQTFTSSPKLTKLSEQSMASGVDAALRLLPSEQEAVLRTRIAALEAEVAQLNAIRPVAELSPQRSGWCFKYNSLAATLGWLGDTGALSRWEKRFFVLAQGEHGAELRYYRGKTDGTPRSVILLADVVLVDEGTRTPRRRRRGSDDGDGGGGGGGGGGGEAEASTQQFHVFSLWAQGTMHSSRGPGSGALLRLSCASEPEALQWLSWIAAGTLDRKVRRSSFAKPTGSPTAASASASTSAPAPAPAPEGGSGGLRRRLTATAAPPIDAAAAPRSTAAAGDATPPRVGGRRTDAAQPHPPEQEQKASEQKASEQKASQQKASQRGGFDPFLFPASRPMHRHAQPSLLSHGEPGGTRALVAPRPEASPSSQQRHCLLWHCLPWLYLQWLYLLCLYLPGRGEANLRGFLHLMFLMLFATHLRLLLENILKYGWLTLTLT